jgi:hypothetical protein
MTLRLVGALAAVVLAVGCGGDAQVSYRDVLLESYPPLERSLEAAVEPCQAEDFSACGTHSARALDHARTLLRALEKADVPDGLEEADRQFKRGLAALATVLECRLPAIEARDDDALASLRTCCSGAEADLVNPIGLFNQKLDLDLRP